MALTEQTQNSISLHPLEMGVQTSLYPSSTFDPDYLSHIPVCAVRYAKAKRMLDILFSLVGLILFSWVYALAALFIKLTSKGPVIFKQTRVGVGGRHFTCYKFRSMCVDAESKKKDLLHLNECSGPVFKIENDPRITRVGRILRKLSIDELPQLVNVLFGDMSIVGPRPPLPHEVAKYTRYEFGRLAVKPGLTCLWQISGRSNIDFKRWVELDILYIESMTFWNDIKIIFKTIPAVLTCRGAK